MGSPFILQRYAISSGRTNAPKKSEAREMDISVPHIRLLAIALHEVENFLARHVQLGNDTFHPLAKLVIVVLPFFVEDVWVSDVHFHVFDSVVIVLDAALEVAVIGVAVAITR